MQSVARPSELRALVAATSDLADPLLDAALAAYEPWADKQRRRVVFG